MPSLIAVGIQWGDEGKGKVVDLLSKNAQHVIRSQAYTTRVGNGPFPTELGSSELSSFLDHTQARAYLERVQELCGAPISLISLGPEREKTIFLRQFFKR